MRCDLNPSYADICRAFAAFRREDSQRSGPVTKLRSTSWSAAYQRETPSLRQKTRACGALGFSILGSVLSLAFACALAELRGAFAEVPFTCLPPLQRCALLSPFSPSTIGRRCELGAGRCSARPHHMVVMGIVVASFFCWKRQTPRQSEKAPLAVNPATGKPTVVQGRPLYTDGPLFLVASLLVTHNNWVYLWVAAHE